MATRSVALVGGVLSAAVGVMVSPGAAAQRALEIAVTARCEGQPVANCPLIVGTSGLVPLPITTDEIGQSAASIQVLSPEHKVAVLVASHDVFATSLEDAKDSLGQMWAIYSSYFVCEPYVFVAGSATQHSVVLDFEPAHGGEFRVVAGALFPSPGVNLNGFAWLEGVPSLYDIYGTALDFELGQIRYGQEWDVYVQLEVTDAVYRVPVHSDDVLHANEQGNRLELVLQPPSRDVSVDFVVQGMTDDYRRTYGDNVTLVNTTTGHAYVCRIGGNGQLAPRYGHDDEQQAVPAGQYVVAPGTPTTKYVQGRVVGAMDAQGPQVGQVLQEGGVVVVQIDQQSDALVVQHTQLEQFDSNMRDLGY